MTGTAFEATTWREAAKPTVAVVGLELPGLRDRMSPSNAKCLLHTG